MEAGGGAGRGEAVRSHAAAAAAIRAEGAAGACSHAWARRGGGEVGPGGGSYMDSIDLLLVSNTLNAELLERHAGGRRVCNTGVGRGMHAGDARARTRTRTQTHEMHAPLHFALITPPPPPGAFLSSACTVWLATHTHTRPPRAQL